MVRRALRPCSIVGARAKNSQIFANHDPVETRDRSLRMITGTGKGDSIFMQEFDQATAMMRPFVKVSHQDRGHFFWPVRNRIDDRPNLPPSPETRKVEVHPDDA